MLLCLPLLYPHTCAYLTASHGSGVDFIFASRQPIELHNTYCCLPADGFSPAAFRYVIRCVFSCSNVDDHDPAVSGHNSCHLHPYPITSCQENRPPPSLHSHQSQVRIIPLSSGRLTQCSLAAAAGVLSSRQWVIMLLLLADRYPTYIH